MPKGRHSTLGISNRSLLFGGLLIAGAVYFMRKAAAQGTSSAPTLTSPSSGSLPAQGPLTTVGPVSLLPIQAGTQNIPELPATMAPTAPEIGSSVSLWDNLTPVPGLTSGYINFPSGAQSAAALFPTRMDSSGQYYVQWAGLVYVLGSQDGSGNWPAQAVG
jgi:hypothetical protein